MVTFMGITAIAVVIASCNLFALYRHEKEQTMATVRKCAENAFLLEMIGRMQRGVDARQSFVRLNTFIESAQQKDGRPGKSGSSRKHAVHMLNWAIRSVKFLGVEFDQSEDEEVSVSDTTHL